MKSLQNFCGNGWRDSHVPDPSRDDIIEAGIQPCPCDQDPQFIVLSNGGREGITFQKFVMPRFQETAREVRVNNLGIIPPLSITSTTMYQRTVVRGSWLWTTKCRSESQQLSGNHKSSTSHIVHCHKLQPQLCPCIC